MLEYVAITVAAVAGEHGFQEDVLRQQNLLDVAVVNQLADRAGVLLVGGRLRRLVGVVIAHANHVVFEKRPALRQFALVALIGKAGIHMAQHGMA
ncbi:Uncharacterised protein [Klebsiella pneumoniae]|nr:Uncharacterised protein [Klebsiella pneumoniae]